MTIVARITVVSATLLIVAWASGARAQVDWSDLFGTESGMPAGEEPAPPAEPEPQAPARPAAPAPARPAAPPPRAAQPAAPAPEPEPARAAQPQRAAPEPPAPVAAAAERNGRPSLAAMGLTEGQVIDHTNVDQYEDYFSLGVNWGIRYGWRLRTTRYQPIEMTSAYREATEKYSGQVRMVDGGRALENYVAGQPFPDVDPNDPQAARKIMWNFYYGWAYTDDLDARLFDADTGTIAPARAMEVERHYIVDHLRRLYYNGRLYVEPKPVFPNDEGYRFKESIHPLLEPFDLKGVGATFYRYLDPGRQDDSWLYLPQLRRVRRLSSAQRSDALFGQDTDVDSYYGYNGHVAWAEYKLLGVKNILATMHAENVPVKWQEPENYFFDDVWEPRSVWVVEARSKLQQYAYGKRVLFIDREAYVIPYSDIYDRAGQLWKIWVNMYGFRKEAIPGARVSVYEDEMAFGNAVIMLDMQLAHATKASIPSTKSRGEEGWFLNMGERSGTTEEFFTIAHLIEVGH